MVHRRRVCWHNYDILVWDNNFCLIKNLLCSQWFSWNEVVNQSMRSIRWRPVKSAPGLKTFQYIYIYRWMVNRHKTVGAHCHWDSSSLSSYFRCFRLCSRLPVSVMERWRGRVALVTGASVGIGAAVAVELVRLGMKVVGCARDVRKLQVCSELTNWISTEII